VKDNPVKISAFTVKYDKIVDILVSHVKVSLPNFGNKLPKKHLELKAIWDCGADGSFITKNVAKELKLKPINEIKVIGIGGFTIGKLYLIDIYLSNKIKIRKIIVTECKELVEDYDVLIGMDIISKGDFAVSNFNGKTVFTFRVPSKETIDFVE